ncbi:MAG TPA: CamS family sex pheromone protein [Bacillales bacterium]|nr:CamS family sex pheromone protein [Bacillales bacterium]
MYRRISVIVCGLLLILAGCTTPGLNNSNSNQTQQLVKKSSKGKQEKKVQITPKVDTSEDYYRSVVNFKPSAARGDILYGVDNRLDIDELQTGLMRLSKPTFPTNKFVFQEGQYLSSDTIEKWLGHKTKDDPEGLNEPLPANFDKLPVDKRMAYLKEHPSYLSYVVEQDYLKQSGKNKLKLGGISLAISVPRVYSYQEQDADGRIYRGEVQLDTSTAEAKAKDFAETILQRVRSIDKGALKNVPVVIGLYQEQSQSSLVPGDYFAKTVVPAGSDKVGDWKAVHETHVLFPATGPDKAHSVDQDRFNKFMGDIEKYFPNYVGVIGKGFYKDQNLQHLTINIPIKFYSETEVVSFTQYVSGLISQHNPFPKDVPLDIYISSAAGPEALIVKKADGKEPFVHVFHQ